MKKLRNIWSLGMVFIELCWSSRQEIGASPVIATGARTESQSLCPLSSESRSNRSSGSSFSGQFPCGSLRISRRCSVAVAGAEVDSYIDTPFSQRTVYHEADL